jgi:branched-chain amino acid transport system permease protein
VIVIRARLPFVLFAAVMLVMPLLPVPEFWITQLNYIGLYAIVALGLVLLTGVGGLTSFGQAAFVGVGAYTAAVLAVKFGISPWLTLLAGLGAAVVVALLLGALTLRMSGHYLPLATIAWGLALNYTMANMEWLGKYDGILGVPALSLFGINLADGRRMYFAIWILALAAALAVVHLLDSRPGRAIRSLKSGATMPEAMGISTLRYKLATFVIAAVLAAMSGWLFAHFQRTVNPSPFGLKMGIEYLFMAVLGGVAQVWGAFTGAAVVKLLAHELQSLLPRIFGGSGNYEIIVFGVVIVLVLKYAPQGLWRALCRHAREIAIGTTPLHYPRGPSRNAASCCWTCRRCARSSAASWP